MVVRTIFTVHNRVCVTRVFISLFVHIHRNRDAPYSLSLSFSRAPANRRTSICAWGFSWRRVPSFRYIAETQRFPSQGGIYDWRVILFGVDLSILTRTHSHERASREQITEEAPSTRLHCLRRHGNIHNISNVWSRFLSQCHGDGEHNAVLCAKFSAEPIYQRRIDTEMDAIERIDYSHTFGT